MAIIGVQGGDYKSRSLTAANQRVGNLYMEPIPAPQGEPIIHGDFPTPGLTLLGVCPTTNCRGLYTASNGDLYAVYGSVLYYIGAGWTFNVVGTFTYTAIGYVVPPTTPVSMADNGITMLIVDGSPDGWTVDLASRGEFTRINISATDVTAISATTVDAGTGYSVNDVLTAVQSQGAGVQIAVLSTDVNGVILTQEVVAGGNLAGEYSTPFNFSGGTGVGFTAILNYATGTPNAGFYGSISVAYQDGFFILSKPNSSVFYVSGSLTTSFDPLMYASKTGEAGNIIACVSSHRILTLIGEYSTEWWYESGGGGTLLTDFPFVIIPNAFVSVGCCAPYSIVSSQSEIYFLSQDKTGQGIFVKASSNYSVGRVSTYSIEIELASYPTIQDCVGYIYVQEGHRFVIWNFPSANNGRGKTWCYDTGLDSWHERFWSDSNGIEHRHRGQLATSAYNTVVVGDWESGNMYSFDQSNYLDNGNQIVRVRSFAHQIDNTMMKRIVYRQFIANMLVGQSSTSSGQQIPVTNCSFQDTSGTTLQDYSNSNDIGSTFTKLSGSTNAIINDDVLVGAAAGSAQYSAPVTNNANYSMQLPVTLVGGTIPGSGANIYAIGRSNTGIGYQAIVSSDGTDLFITLNVLTGISTTQVNMGNTISDYVVLLNMFSNDISVTVNRLSDGTWLNPNATWSGIETAAISISDSNYPLAGTPLLGGTWV